MPRKARLRVALYARVSTKDKDQDPDTQLFRLRDFVGVHQDWAIRQEYIDIASASDLGHRTAWSSLMADAMQKRFDAVVVFKLDRAFRSVLHMHQTLAQWDSVRHRIFECPRGIRYHHGYREALDEHLGLVSRI
jgi:DNA invertase Pin-like site-specific DNA recombinase